MLNRNVETFLGCESEYDKARIVVFGAPFDSTTSNRPGARFAGRAMRAESWGLETYSPYLDADLTDMDSFDGGDLELPFGNAASALDRIEAFSQRILEDGKFPLMIGGEHLVALGAIRAAIKKYPDLRIIHFDAHADLREDYLGERLSHATVLRRVWEAVGDNRIYQFAIRSGDRTEFEWGKKHVFTRRFDFCGLEVIAEKLSGFPIYLTLDLDVLDPSVFPGTGTPEAGGVSYFQLMEALLQVGGLNLVGCDISELSPACDPSGVSTAVACKVLREMLLIIGRTKEYYKY